jgi:predicted AAA+ superfamily ATPase
VDRSILEDWNTHWNGGKVSRLVQRHPGERAAVPHMIRELLDPSDAQWSLRPGPRQIGKTTSLGHVARGLLDEGIEPHRIIIAPMDDPSVQNDIGGNLQALIDDAFKMHPGDPHKPLFLLLDEIQELDRWDLQLKTAWDRYHDRVRLTATGSSALRLVRSTGASLANRVRVTRMFPMKYREVLGSHSDRDRHLDETEWTELQRLARAVRVAFLDDKQAVRRGFEALHSFIAARPRLGEFLRSLFLEYCVYGGYPSVRPGGPKQGVERLEFFEAAWGSMVARDLPHSGVRDVLGFNRMFRSIGKNTGGKFVPAKVAKNIGDVKPDTVKSWKKVLEDLHLVQQLGPLKPNLEPDNAKDKAYLQDPGWFAYWQNILDHAQLLGRPVMGNLVETVIVDHLRRLRFNLFHTTAGPVGYVSEPEVDVCMQIGERWLLVEVKMDGKEPVRLREIGKKQDLRIVVSERRSDLSDSGSWTIPAHEIALIC